MGQYLQSRWASLSRKRGQVKAGGIPLLELPAAVGLPLSKVWLSLLLGEGGGRLVQESEDFYNAAGVRVIWSGEVKLTCYQVQLELTQSSKRRKFVSQ